MLQQRGLDPIHEPFPELLAHQNDGESLGLGGLNQRDGFEKFVQRAESTGQYDIALAVLHEHHLAHEEIVKFEAGIRADIGVVVLLVGQPHVEAHRYASGLVRAFVSGLHDARSASSDDTVPTLYQLSAYFRGQLVIGIIDILTGGSKNADARSYALQASKAFHELGHDLKDGPAVVCFDVVPAPRVIVCFSNHDLSR